jgi:putative DNA primase/helicase
MSLPEWGLDLTKDQIPRSTLANAVTVLQHDPNWGPETIWYDVFLDRVLTANSPTREWRDDDDTRLTVYMQQEIGMATIPITQVSSAIQYVARQRQRHCVLDWLDTLVWDDINRIEHAFEDFWGAEPSATQPCEYLRAVSANFFLGAVARVLRPGCQLDTMPIFEGAQGIGKSKALRVLGGPWYMLAAESVTHKDFFQSFPGKWIIEVGEMDSFSKAERERVKLAISTPTDRYRSSYGRRAEDHPRQCLFAGTTNRDDYGNDDSGLRRFLPVRCVGAIDIDGIASVRPQFFAESYARIKAGATWWETPGASTLAVQADRQADDPWALTVHEWLVGKSDATSAEILEGALKFRTADMTRTDQNRIGSILRLLGWRRQTIRRAGLPVKAWVMPE